MLSSPNTYCFTIATISRLLFRFQNKTHATAKPLHVADLTGLALLVALTSIILSPSFAKASCCSSFVSCCCSFVFSMPKRRPTTSFFTPSSWSRTATPSSPASSSRHHGGLLIDKHLWETPGKTIRLFTPLQNAGKRFTL